MSLFQQMLIFIGVPVLVIAAVFALIYLRNPRPQTQFKPGDDYNFAPVWFVAKDSAISSDADVAEATSTGPKGGSHGKW